MNLARTTKTAMHARIVALESELALEREARAQAFAHVATLEKERDALRAAHERIRLELELIKRRMTVARAERVDTQQLEMEFAEKLAELNALAGTPKDAPADNHSPPKKPKGKPKGRRNLHKGALPHERIEITDPVFEAMVAEGRATRIGSSNSARMAHRRGGKYILTIARITYRMQRTSGASTLATALMPRETFARSLAAPSLIAHIIAQKYLMGLPLYRLEEQCAREGFEIDRSTMARWLLDAGETFGASIVAAMLKDAIANAFCIATDATGLLIQPIPNEARTRQPCKRGHIFAQVVDRDAIIFSYTERETSLAVKSLFKNFTGYIQADAKNVYDALFRPPDDASADADIPTEVGCWSHARRRYWEATVAKSVVAREGLMRIGRIFELDASWKDKPPSDIKNLRQAACR